MKGYIGLDLGSTAIKAVLISEAGEVLDTAGERIVFKDSEAAAIREIDPEKYFHRIFSLLKHMSRQVEEVRAVSWVAASGNLLFINKTGTPVTPIISWLDTTPVSSGLTAEDAGLTDKEIYTTVGWPFSLQFPLGRLFWLNRQRPELFSSGNLVCMNNDYLGRLLTGKWAVDNSTATTFYMYDQQKMQKHLPFIEAAGLDPEQVPEVYPVGHKLGSVTKRAAEETGLSTSTEIILGSFDHPGAARALQLSTASQLMFSCGTSWVGCVLLPDRKTGLQKRMLIDPYESNDGGEWFGMFSLTSIGQFFDTWVIDFMKFTGFTEGDPFKQFDALAMECGCGIEDQVPIINPLTNPSTPALFETLCAAWEISAVARGVLEGVVFRMKKLVIEKGIDIGTLAEILLVGGPTESSVWPQIIADIFQKKVVIRFGKTAGAVGAAVIAAGGAGYDLHPYCKAVVIKPNLQKAADLEARYKLSDMSAG